MWMIANRLFFDPRRRGGVEHVRGDLAVRILRQTARAGFLLGAWALGNGTQASPAVMRTLGKHMGTAKPPQLSSHAPFALPS